MRMGRFLDCREEIDEIEEIGKIGKIREIDVVLQSMVEELIRLM